jgi:hypothetical protein
LETERREIEQGFLYKVPGFGTVIFRSRRKAFDEQIEHFKGRVKDYSSAMEKQIEKATNETIAKLTQVILPLVKQNPPARYLKSALSDPSDEDFRNALKIDLERNFGKPDAVMKPTVKVLFKDVAYETIHAGDFKKALYKSGIPEHLIEKLFPVHDAAPETGK